MKQLAFNVEDQNLEPAESFGTLIRGSKGGYLHCKFNFLDEDWKRSKKICVFMNGKQESAILLKNDECSIPDEVAKQRVIKMYLVGVLDKITVKTNNYYIRQVG